MHPYDTNIEQQSNKNAAKERIIITRTQNATKNKITFSLSQNKSISVFSYIIYSI